VRERVKERKREMKHKKRNKNLSFLPEISFSFSFIFSIEEKLFLLFEKSDAASVTKNIHKDICE
jgi:hypothetical protein